MPKDVDAGFHLLVSNLRTTQFESMTAASHRTSIEAKLKEVFGTTSFFRTGSFGNGTNVSRYSDVDYFAVIPRAHLKQNSSATLAEVASALRERFPTTSNIRVNSPGVQVPFGLDGAEHTEIVPVDFTGYTTLNFRQFDIPDGGGGWKFSAPESHKEFVQYHDERLGGRLKPLIRLIKAWRWYRNVPIKSFYIEMFVTQRMLGEPAIVYSIDVKNVLRALASSGVSPIVDPRFTEFVLTGCSTEQYRLDAAAKAESAADWAERAWTAEHDGRPHEAFNCWDLVFNYHFPSYSAIG
ncbi:nucleotidyltransferase [Rhizobium leguminosarum bv. viciae]|nr:nucleotidyltransferase [Rhizobium leguminosarum bv. viciae]